MSFCLHCRLDVSEDERESCYYCTGGNNCPPVQQEIDTTGTLQRDRTRILLEDIGVRTILDQMAHNIGL